LLLACSSAGHVSHPINWGLLTGCVQQRLVAKGIRMNNIIYIVGVIVIVLLILGWLGLR
jgi:hypothetical protein